ncbi:2-oxoacid:acceptor oxidoreductase subunit alpha [Patescibacteria group bacterium]|nr:2-oxoacid:acceptor oxidoreductase subunit alpha [Patescibacteria group bacterium]
MEIDNSLCKECGICMEFCQQKAIVKNDGLKIIQEKCNSCRQCELLCPEGAICFKNEEIEKIKSKIKSEKRGGWINSKPLLKTGQKYFLSGNDACAEGALAAGCRFFAGYPITPASEILERMAIRMPKLNGSFIQMEDEIASMAAIIGASWAGVKSMTATSGPGFSLMQENISFADMTETPCVIINVQRGGPSTGMPTKPSTGDIRMARWGDHGGLQHIALCPASVQECYDLTIKAFNLSEKYRTPVIILTDAFLAHLTETLIIKPQKVFNRIYIPNEPPFGPTKNYSAPSMPNFADGEHLMITGSAHDERGWRNTADSESYEKLIHHLENKIIKKRPIDVEKFFLEDAKQIIVAYGLVGRIAKEAIKKARKKGEKIGLLRLKILWPFPTEIIKKYEKRCAKFIVPEMNQGQLFFVVREKVSAKVVSLPQQDGELINPERIYKYIMKGIW